MPRPLRVAAAQVGRIDRGTPRPQILARLLALLDQAASQNVKLVVFPETTFTTFFPRYLIFDQAELDSYFEVEDAETGIVESANVKAFFDKAKELDVDVVIGYAEKMPDGTPYNTASYVSGGRVVSKYRKVHLPGTFEPFNDHPDTTNQLEKRYFRPGNLGFRAFRAPNLRHGTRSPIVGMLICNDRRWAEGWRCYGLQGIEIACIGFNTTAWAPELWGSSENLTRDQARDDAMFHHKLVVQANAYSNASTSRSRSLASLSLILCLSFEAFCITSARCGWDDGKFELITGSMIVDPEGYIVAENKSDGDELVVADIDLDACSQTRKACTFDELPPERKKPTKRALPPSTDELHLGGTSSPGSDSLTHVPDKRARRTSTAAATTDNATTTPGGSNVDFAGMHALIEAATQQEHQRAAAASTSAEPASLDLSISDTLEPHALTTLLTDDLLPIGTRQAGPDSSDLPETGYIRQISADKSKPQYIIFSSKPHKRVNARPAQEQLNLVKATLSMLHPPPPEQYLVDVYVRTCNSAFPVLTPPSDYRTLELPLLRKVYLTSLIHCREYRASARAVRRIDLAGSVDKGQNSTRLSSISLALLDLSGRPVLDAEDRYILLAKTIAQAQLLGLHIDPTNWVLPTWEKDLRRVLWWALHIHDAWMSFLNARPRHIQSGNHSVPLPLLSSVLSTSGLSSLSTTDSVRSPQSFVWLCRLSLLVARLQERVCTLASEQASRQERLSRVMEIEIDAGKLLQEVREEEAQAMITDVVPTGVDVGHILSSITSSLIRLSLATTSSSPSHPSSLAAATLQANLRTNPIILLSRLIFALRTANQKNHWDLAEAALNRAESVATVLRSADEFANVV
ncbi:hypothetical protein EW146_g9872, partial [Bondarzewia mesenterica]